MPRPRDVTPRACPLCGRSDVAPPTGCALCKGTKLVDVATWRRWSDRPPARETSTTVSIRAIALGRVEEVLAVGGPRSEPLVQRGRGLVAVIDSWLEVPADGRERASHYQQVNAWLSETSEYLRGMK